MTLSKANYMLSNILALSKGNSSDFFVNSGPDTSDKAVEVINRLRTLS